METLNRYFYKFFQIIFLLSFFNLPAQSVTPDSVEIVFQKEFSTGSFHKLFFGEHWRNLWTTPVKIPVLNISTFGDGLIPTGRGGGQQTKSIRFKDKYGNTWKFRSITKDPSKVLTPELRESLVSDILLDQISSSNPVGALAANYLLDAAGVLNAKPYLFYLPDDEKLGGFRNEFGNLPGILEAHPDEQNADDNFAAAEKIVGTYKLYSRLEEERDEKVDALEYLKARLMDCLMGDWDRHTDQWRWARYTVNNKKIWLPIPRDRDQVFPKYDGLLPSLAPLFVLQLNHFDYDYPHPRNMTWNARLMDQRFLSEIKKEKWDSTAAYLQNVITDEVIETAVHQLPDELYLLAKDELISKLKSRRDKLKNFSDNYYNWINRYADVYASMKDDFVLVSRINNRSTQVSVFAREKETGEKKGEPFFDKIFENSITEEIRIYLLDGDDKIVVKGEVDESPLVRVTGGKGDDEFADSSFVHGYFLDFTPFKNLRTQTEFYDSGNKSKFVSSGGTFVDQTKYYEPENDSIRYEPLFKDRYHEWEVNPVLTYNKDNGVVFGAGPKFFKYNFRMNPYEYWWTLVPSYATNSKSFNLVFQGMFNSIIKGAQVFIEAGYTEMFLSKYFGYGNKTFFDEELSEGGYNRLNQQVMKIHPTILFEVYKNVTLQTGFSVQSFKTSLNTRSLLAGYQYGSYGLGKLDMFTLHTAFVYDSRDNFVHPYSGSFAKITVDYYPQLWGIEEHFIKSTFDLRYFHSLKTFTDFVFAFRAGGEKIFGKYPFISSVFLGGKENLRGYNRERFSGEASLFAQAEMRAYLTTLNIVIPSRVGVNLFYESGRVFAKTNSPDKWHPSYGFGFWFSFLNRAVNFSLTVAFSPQEEFYHFSSKMGF